MQFVDQTQAVEVSVVIPCLNEQDTLARCLEKARKAFSEHGIAGEILVADNGSTDLSRTIAEREGARVVTVQEPGYGSALMGGIAVPPSGWWWFDSAWRDAIFTSLDWQSSFFLSRTKMVRRTNQRRLLRSAWFYQVHVRTA